MCVPTVPMFGEGLHLSWARILEGRILIMNNSVFGTKTTSAAFHEFLAHELAKLDFLPSKAD